MAGLYHINGDSVSPCKAQKGHCPFGQGAEENHFSDPKEAMEVLEKRLADEYGGSTSTVSKGGATAKDLAAQGADPKEVRDALRKENPGWDARRIHTVQAQMTGGGSRAKKAPAAPSPAPLVVGPAQVKALHDNWEKSKKAVEAAQKVSADLYKEEKTYDSQYGAAEGRAYYYDYKQGTGKIQGVNPNGSTYFDRHPVYKAKADAARAEVDKAVRNRENAQTLIEEAGLGHTIPDEGNTIRVRTQAQKWLLENELKGQISDGKWENSGPQEHWMPWSSATVVVDPDNVGRNFYAQKDNYQLNASELLEIVGDRMKEDVRERTGKDYDDKAMMKDLRDLRSIFKTQRPTHTP